MTLKDIAKEMGVSRPRVSAMKAQGMPTDSLESALAWREEHIGKRVTVSERAMEVEPSIYDIAVARAKREHHEANLAEMREAKEAGALVERSSVTKAATDAGALLRQALERLPALADELSALPGPEAIRARIAAAVSSALSDLADNLARIASAEAEAHGRR